MKKKTRFIFSFFTVVFAVLSFLSGCDMDSLMAKPFSPPPADPGFDSSIPCLTIVNLPANTRINHFSNVFVYNNIGVTAKCADYKNIFIIKENGFVTAKIPLSYNDGSDYFRETGTFITSFTANIDYVTYYFVKESDKLRLYFTEGSAFFDAALIPPPPPPYLTITSLPVNTRLQNISNVFVYNDTGTAIAKCADYDQIIITRDINSVTAKVPLYYTGRDEHFVETGNFVVSLFVNINFSTQIIVKEENKLTLPFTEGNALLDASLIPPSPPPPYLTITSLPKNVKGQNFSNVFIFNSVGMTVARCADYDQIIITKDSDFATARIPLVYDSNGQPFRDSGYFNVSFSLYIDSYIDISKTKDDALSVPFTDGSGEFDFLRYALSSVELGYFSGGLTNPSDTAAPVIRSGTKFEMNGHYYTANSNMAVVPASFSNSCVVYIYARLVFDQLEFIYSTVAPAYDNYKKGYYNGWARALFKFVFILDSANKYFAKTFINNDWEHLRYQTIDSGALASRNLHQHYYLSGKGTPYLHTITFPTGVYLFILNGTQGGSSKNQGGAGGHVSEVVILSKNTSFTFYSGEKGDDGYHATTPSSINISVGAGGGSGSFAFSPDGYFLCAGGGGGSAGAITSSDNSDNLFYGGGAGGSIGGGGAGGVSGDAGLLSSIMSGSGGGGYYGGQISLNILSDNKNGYSGLTVHSYSLGFFGSGSSSNGGSAAYFDISPPYNWLNTNNANGKGGSSSLGYFNSINFDPPQAGGNNRNSSRGGGETLYGNVTAYKIN